MLSLIAKMCSMSRSTYPAALFKNRGGDIDFFGNMHGTIGVAK